MSGEPPVVKASSGLSHGRSPEPARLVLRRLRDDGEVLSLAGVEVHVRYFRLDLAAPELQPLHAILSADERTRAERFYAPRHGERFVAARGQLRQALAGYLGSEPKEVRFRYGSRGKPALAEEFGDSLRFNLSHSGELALLAVAERSEVGADVEVIDPNVDHERIATRSFSEVECANLLALPPAARGEGFFRCWTRKEAYIKALGEGFSHPLADFDVTLAPGVAARLLATRRDPKAAARWAIVDLTPQPGYAAALALEVNAGPISEALSAPPAASRACHRPRNLQPGGRILPAEEGRNSP